MNRKKLAAFFFFFKKTVASRHNPMETVAGAAFVLAVFGIASRVLGLLRDRILASRFGAGDTLDAYYAAFRIPDLLYNLLVLGALSAAFIPVFTEVMETKTRQRAWKLGSSVLLFLVAVMIVLSIFGIVFLPWLVPLITPGFDETKQHLVESFIRIMFLSPIFLGASAVLGGMLVSRRCFWAYSVAPIFYNVGIIFGATIGVRLWGVMGLAWGVAIGACLHFLVQLFAARHIGFVFVLERFRLWKDEYVRRIIALMIPRTLTVAANQINLFVITIYASTLASGSLAVFNFANNLQSVPLALFGISFATAAFPRLSEFSAKKDRAGFSRTFYRTLKRILLFVVPVTALLLVLRAQIVRVTLGTGAFDWEDTVLTFDVLGILAASLFAQSVLPLLARSFYSLQDTKTPFYIALFSEGLNAILAFVLVREWGVFGLATSFSVAAIVQMGLMGWFLRKNIGRSGKENLFLFLVKVTVASLLATIVAQAMKGFLGTVTNLSTFWEVLAQLLFSGIAGATVFLLSARWLCIDEFDALYTKAIKKLLGKS